MIQQKPKVEQKSSCSILLGQLVRLILKLRANNPDHPSHRGTAVTTYRVSVRLWCPAASALTETRMAALMPILPRSCQCKPHNRWIETKREEGRCWWEEKRTQVCWWWCWVGVVLDRRRLRPLRAPALLLEWSFSKLMRIFNICWVYSVLEVIRHSIDSDLAGICWVHKMPALRHEEDRQVVCSVQKNMP